MIASLLAMLFIPILFATAIQAQTDSPFSVHPNGGGLVEKTALVSAKAYLGPGVLVEKRAVVAERARIKGRVLISDKAFIDSGVVIKGPKEDTDQIVISGKAMILEGTVIKGKGILITGRSLLEKGMKVAGEKIIIKDYVEAKGSNSIGDNTTLEGMARIWGEGISIHDSRLSGHVAVIDLHNKVEIKNRTHEIPMADLRRFPFHPLDYWVQDTSIPIHEPKSDGSINPSQVEIAISNPGMDPTVDVISPERAQELMEAAMAFKDDMHLDFVGDGCFNRAQLIGLHLEEAFGIRSAKAFLEVPKIHKEKFLKDHDYETYGETKDSAPYRLNGIWGYHVATMVVVFVPEFGFKHMIMDPLLSSMPIDEREWIRMITKEADPGQKLRYYYAHRFALGPKTSNARLEGRALFKGSNFLEIASSNDPVIIRKGIQEHFQTLISEKDNKKN